MDDGPLVSNAPTIETQTRSCSVTDRRRCRSLSFAENCAVIVE